MNPFLAAEYDTLNNVRALQYLRGRATKTAGFVDAAMARMGFTPDRYPVLFPLLSQASTWTLRDSTANLPSWLNQFKLLQKGPAGVYPEALSRFQSFMAGGGGPQTVAQTMGTVIPGMPLGNR